MLALYDSGIGRLRCPAPPGVPGDVTFQITFNKQQFITLGKFRYFDTQQGLTFAPSSVSFYVKSFITSCQLGI